MSFRLAPEADLGAAAGQLPGSDPKQTFAAAPEGGSHAPQQPFAL
jgi:hypothetical protein